MTSHATPPCRILALSPELLGLMSYHLRPRHLYKLMLTCKELKARVDNERYWERAAVHAVWRHIGAVEIMDCDEKYRQFPRLSGLYDLLNLDLGYYESINEIIRRVRQVMANDETPGDGWKKHANDPLVGLVRAGENFIQENKDEFSDCHLEYVQQEAKTMKDVVKREVNSSLRMDNTMKAKLRKFQRDIDDDSSMSIQAKRHFMQKWGKLLWNICQEEMRDTDLIDIAHMVSNFY